MTDKGVIGASHFSYRGHTNIEAFLSQPGIKVPQEVAGAFVARLAEQSNLTNVPPIEHTIFPLVDAAIEQGDYATARMCIENFATLNIVGLLPDQTA